MRKYEFTGEEQEFCGVVLRRIQAVRGFWYVKAGECGGWIEREENLSHDGDAWVHGNGRVYGNGRVCGNGEVYEIGQLYISPPIGSRNDFTSYFRDADNEIMVSCGYFLGKIDEFEKKVREKHGESGLANVYLSDINTAKLQIELPGKKGEKSDCIRNTRG